MFVDEVEIQVSAGDGGRGCMSFRREKFVPRGGPNGGDGGGGGSVFLVASEHINTLVNYRFNPEHHAGRGAHGEGSNRTGRTGGDLELEVPPGTLVYEKAPDASLTLLADLSGVGDRVLVARGGRGGRGNARFATATNRAPRRADPGEPGEVRLLRLQLTLLADVGLVGFPNTGKSTLISRISAARPKIADYPFTTLTPNLGVVRLDQDRSFVAADIPGLIEGAHAGHGLGHQFLRHLERTKLLVHVVDVSSASGRDPVHDLDVIHRELALFGATPDASERRSGLALDQKPQIIAANKIDSLDDPSRLTRLKKAARRQRLDVYPISAASGEGIDALLEAMWRGLSTAGEESSSVAPSPSPDEAEPVDESRDRGAAKTRAAIDRRP